VFCGKTYEIFHHPRQLVLPSSLTWKVESEVNETSQAPAMTDRFTSLEDKINMTAMVRNSAAPSALVTSFIIQR